MTDSASAGDPALAVVGARKRFDDTMAVDDLDLNVMDSEILALVGPSGCGKTTLLRAVAGIAGLDSGTIRIAGVVVDDSRRQLPPEKRCVGLVFQEHSLFPHLTVLDNVAFGIRDANRRDTRIRAGEALELVKLGRFGARYPHELSGGERQRVALARALAPRPALMLLDEPFASLDPNLRNDLRRDVIAALRETQTPAVFVTHDQGEALASGDRIAVMRAGRIEQHDEPDRVFHEPRNRFVAAFMGEASFLPVTNNGHGPASVLGPVDVGPDGERRPGLAMVRPDDVEFTADPSGDAIVTAGEFRGTTWSYTITVADGAEVLSNRSHIDRLEVGARGRVTLAAGHRQVPIHDDP